jgi:sugar phosphate isomerase/epimerase
MSVEVEDLPNLGQTDPLARVEALDECKVWLDKGKILGCYGIRVNVSRGKDPVDIGVAVDTLRKGAEYAHSIGMLLQVENHGGLTGRIPDMINLVRQVNDPYLKIEVDWGAWDPPGDRYADIQAAMPYVHMVSAKGEIFDETTYEHSNYDIPRIVKNAEAGGFRGVYSVELWHMPGPKDTDRAVRSFMKAIADNMA